MQIVLRTLVGLGSVVTVLDDAGVERMVAFPAIPNPSDDQIIAAVGALPQTSRVLVGVASRVALRADRDAKYAEWQQAKTARAEVVARAVPGDQAWATAGQGFAWVEAAWTAYRAAVIAWAAAA